MTDLTLDPSGSYRHPDDPGEPSTGGPRLSVTDEEAVILADYAKGKQVLEIGTGLGVSTRALASTARVVITIDVDPWVHETIWPALPRNVWGAVGLPDGVFDVVFIDGDHSTAAVAADFAAALTVTKPGGVILAHDINYADVQRGLGDGWVHLDTRHGIGVYQVPA